MVVDMVNIRLYDEYRCSIPSPVEPCKPMALGPDATHQDQERFYEQMINYETKYFQYLKDTVEYDKEVQKQRERFERDLMVYCGITTENVHRKIYALAYEDGHAFGFESVKNYYIKYANFAKDILTT